MRKKRLNDTEIESALEEIFGLPSDPDQSEDDEESDEEHVFYNPTKLQRILEDFDEPGLRSNIQSIRVSPQPCTSNDEPNLQSIDTIRASLSPQPSTSSTDLSSSTYPDRGQTTLSPQPSTSSTDLHSSTGSGPTTLPAAVRGNKRGIVSKRRAEKSPDRGDSTTDKPFDIEVESETDASDEDENMWKKILWTNDRPQPDSFDSVPMTPTRMLPSNARPIRHFEKFFTQEVFEWIVTETNRYADQENIVGWTEIDIRELKVFLGIIIIMGYHILPCLELYWSSDPAFRVDEIASTMPFRRFKQILRCIHLNDNSKRPQKSDPAYDKLYKVRPLVTLLNRVFQENARNSSSQSIDESMIVFKGRSSLKQYMPLKPIKRGFKVWCRCDSRTGYIYEFDIYTGKDGDRVEDSLGAKVVTKLTEKLKGMAVVHVTFDNFFCGYEIMNYLYTNGIHASGTVRRQRADLPEIVKSKRKLKLKKGEYKWRVKGDVAFVIWHDTKEVLFLSNAFHPKVNVTSVTRKQKDGTKIEVPCPVVAKEYTKRMGGVDHFDHIKATYSVGRRSKRWWLRIFYFLVDACITNSFLLYGKNANSAKLTNLEFRIALARGLIGGFSSRKRSSVGVNYIVRKKATISENYQKSVYITAPETRFSNVGDHMPVDLPSYQRCRYCSTKIKDKRSKIKCSKCQVPLCITPCFFNFHKQAPT